MNETATPSPPSLRRRAWNRLKDVVFMIAAVLFLRTFVVQAYQIPSGSMEETLLVGDFLIANKFIYGPHIPFTEHKIKGREPRRGEIAIFRSPADDKDYIKRVIGLPGETVEIRENRVFIDGEPLDEAYVHLDGCGNPPQAFYGPVTVPEGHIFVLGDNRNKSYDSRFWGFLDESLLRGRAEVIHWSWDTGKHRPRLGRIGDLL
ncbi:MAG: signal peptidase I [Candidatus Eisenbacteria bacterium]|nr:signal peptidase I [Candidatus Eisenbacteria bacterium]